MKLSEYVKNLNELIEKRPETAEFDVIYSKDDEGNDFNPVYFAPGVGTYDPNCREFMPDNSEDDEESENPKKPNAVCVN